MYQKIIKPLIFALSSERAYRLIINMLRFVGMIPGGRWLLKRFNSVEHQSLEREVFGMKFRNPIGLAAGFDRNAEVFREMSALGFSFVEVGAVTPKPQGGNPRPHIFPLKEDKAIINRLGLENRGLDRMVAALRHPHPGLIVGCNIAKNSSTPIESASADYLKLFRNLYEYVDYFTVNISCSNTSSDCVTHTQESIIPILEPLFAFRRGQNEYRPILIKISPDMSDEIIDGLTDLMIATPLDGIVATNGTSSREGLMADREHVESLGAGRLSGKPLTNRSLEVVKRIHQRSKGRYPIIGLGGIMTPQDAKAMLDAGASLVQIYTGLIYEGPKIVKSICNYLIETQDGAKK